MAHRQARDQIAARVAGSARDLWSKVDRSAIGRSWQALLPDLMVVLTAAQVVAARAADPYLAAVLAAQDLVADPDGEVNPRALAGVAADGRPLDTVLGAPVVSTFTTLGAGAPLPRAMAAGQATLDMVVRTQVADAGRVADQVAIAARPRVAGYVRMLTPPSCSRCVILAGRKYRYNTGFRRHPRCDCTHIPAVEDRADDARTDPRQYFDSLTPAQQDRVFTRAGAEAIRLGADPSQVVNARRGMSTAGRDPRTGKSVGRLAPETVFGQPTFITREGTTRRGLAGARLRGGVRLMPEGILSWGLPRAETIRHLRSNGYIR